MSPPINAISKPAKKKIRKDFKYAIRKKKKELENAVENKSRMREEDKFFCCPKCCLFYIREDYDAFKSHIVDECFVNKRFPCRRCGHIYASQSILDYHVENIHENPELRSKLLKILPRQEYVQAVNSIIEKHQETNDGSAEEPVRPFVLTAENREELLRELEDHPQGLSQNKASDNKTLLRIKREIEEDNWPESEKLAEDIGKASGVWKCWICSYESKQKSLWRTHMNRIHPTAKGRTLKCSFCEFCFPKKHHWREHMNEVHSEQMTYKCEGCNRNFLFKNEKHKCEIIQCELCEKIFDSKSLKSKHMLTHPDFRPFKCSLCPKEFQRREYLGLHMRIHNDLRPYECEFCPKKFRSKSHYNNHRRMHTGEKPYVCHTCGRAFSSPQCLCNHMYTHEGIKNYQCHMCDKAFRTSNDLKRHSIIHTGEKPFSCKICNRGFNRKGNCIVHEKAHNKFQCQICSDTFSQNSQLKKHITYVHLNSADTGRSQPDIPTENTQNNEVTYIMDIDDVAWNIEVENGDNISEETNLTEAAASLWDEKTLEISNSEDDNFYIAVLPMDGMNVEPVFSIVESDITNLSLPIPLIFNNNESFQIQTYFVNEDVASN